MRCVEHGLAVGPEGQCVLCERRERTVSRRAARGMLIWAGIGVLCASAGLLWVRQRGTRLRPEPGPLVATSHVALTPVAVAPTERGPELETAPPADPAPAPAPAETLSVPASNSAPAPTPEAPQPSVNEPARAPSNAEIRTAMTSTPIVMFSASWCPACQKASRFLQANGLSFVAHDVDTDASALAELKRRTGHTAIPVIDIDGTQLPAGFSPRAVISAVAASVERRLGVTGIQIRPVTNQTAVAD